MQEQHRRFNCGKLLALASIYDALERLGWMLVSANSNEGLLLVHESIAGITYVIRVEQSEAQKTDVVLELASGEHSGWNLTRESADRLFQTISGMIEKALSNSIDSVNSSD